jgi:hypothetical protein
MEHNDNYICGGSCVDARGNSRTIPTVGNLYGMIFCYRQNPNRGKAVSTVCSEYIIVKTLQLFKIFKVSSRCWTNWKFELGIPCCKICGFYYLSATRFHTGVFMFMMPFVGLLVQN